MYVIVCITVRCEDEKIKVNLAAAAARKSLERLRMALHQRQEAAPAEMQTYFQKHVDQAMEATAGLERAAADAAQLQAAPAWQMRLSMRIPCRVEGKVLENVHWAGANPELRPCSPRWRWTRRSRS